MRVVAGAVGLSLLSAYLLAQSGTPHRNLALIGATIYTNPTADPIRNGLVLIEDGKIVAVGPKARVRIPPGSATLDCAGLTITAGFWNSHVHFFERKWANAAAIPASDLSRQMEDMFTRFGFTSVFDTGSEWANTRRLRDRIESGEAQGPKIRSTGEPLIARNAAPDATVLRMMGVMNVANFEIAGPEQATTAAKKLLDAGVDGIKVHLQPPPSPNPPFPLTAIPAAVNEAHRTGRPVFVHPNTGADVLAAVQAGVDIVAHTTPSSGPWDDAILAVMKQQHVALTPTLTIWKYYARHDRISTQDQIAATAIGQLRAWVNAGGTVLFGNDIGAVEYDPTEEYTLMAEAGMSFRQILASLTTAPSQQFGESKLSGQVAAGFEADLVVLKRDPSRNIQALADVQYTIRGGKVIHRAVK